MKRLLLAFGLATLSTFSFAQYFSDLEPIKDMNQKIHNPFMASLDNNMHADSYATDVHPYAGPEGFGGRVSTFKFGKIAGECAGILFDKNHNIITVCVKLGKTKLLLIDKDNLKIKTSFELPPRPNVLLAGVTFQFDKMMEDTSGGSYFFMDHKNRAIITTSDRQILVVGQKQKDEKIEFILEKSIDLRPYVPQSNCPTLFHPDFTSLNCDKVTTVLPDYQGNYWFISRYGKVGVVDYKTGKIVIHQLPKKEQLQNSFSIDANGTFIVSTHALYHFSYSTDKGIQVIWRESYDRGSARKPGQVTQGSGTSPSLMGEEFVAISDNAFPRMNVLVYRRGKLAKGENRLVCKVPVFKENASATENSFVVFNKSIIVENNYGNKGPFADFDMPGGVVRVDIDKDEKGCHTVWESNIISPTTVPKLSSANGILYFYTIDKNGPKKQAKWALTGLDFETGKIMTKIYTGTGNEFNNNWGAISIGPDNAAYIGSLKGFIKVKND